MRGREGKLRERDIQGLKYLKTLLPLLERLHDVGCRRDKAGNRKPHYDQRCLLVLLFLFNPVVRSLRSLQQASLLKNVQRKLGCPRTSLGSLSEATDVFDAERLEAIVGELLKQVPAEVIAEIYRSRWTIELFFRFFKHVLGCRHLLSTDPVGIRIQAYCAIIACLLIVLWTGGRPTLRTYEMICFYFAGWADLDEVTAHLEKLPPTVR